MTVRVASLLRLSTKKQATRQGNGEPDIPAQRKAIEEFVATKPGWQVVREFKEELSAFSNSAEDRDVLQEVIKEAEAGAFEVLLVWKGDRLSRIVDELPNIVKRITRGGVQFWSVVDAPGGKQWTANNALELLMLALEGFKNQSESENTSIRVKARMRQLADEGRWHGSKIPFGFDLVARKDERGEPILRGGRTVRDLVPHAEHSPIVREVFRRYLAGQGYYRLAQWLNGLGILTYTGQWWSQKTVKDVLKNPIYAGYIVYARTEGILGTKKRKTGGSPIMAKGKHAPLIDEETWQMALQMREARAKAHVHEQKAEASGTGQYALAGVLKCAVCGGSMGGHMRRYKRLSGELVEYPVYRCLTHKASRRCPVTTYIASEVEHAFIVAVEQLAMPSSLREFIEARDTERHTRARDAREGRERARGRVKELDSEYTRIRMDYRAGKLSADEYNGFRQEIEEERARLQIEAAQQVLELPEKSFNELAKVARDIRNLWYRRDSTPGEQRVFALAWLTSFDIKASVHRNKETSLLQVDLTLMH